MVAIGLETPTLLNDILGDALLCRFISYERRLRKSPRSAE